MADAFVAVRNGLPVKRIVRLGRIARRALVASFFAALGSGLVRAADPGETEEEPSKLRDPVDRVVLQNGKDVKRIQRELPRAYEELLKKKEKETTTVEAWWRLAKFFESKRAFPEQRVCLRAILKLDPENEEAHRAVGDARVDGRWMTEEELDSKRLEGYIVVGGKLVKPSTETGTSKQPGTESASLEPAPKPERPPVRNAEEALRKSAELASKDLDGAIYYAEQAVLLAPELPQVAAQWQKLASKAAKAKFEEAKRALKKKETEKAVQLLLESHYQKFSWIFMGLTDRAAATKGFTVVFFRDRKAYTDYRARKRIGSTFPTAGFYDHGMRASFFYRDPNYGTLWPTMFHEVTHQLCEEYLHAANRVTWVSEGVAQYFEAASVGKDYTVTVGWPLRDALLEIRGGYWLDENKYVPAEAIFRATAVDDPRIRCSVRQAYAQMWAWAYFFLHQGTAHRQAFLACLRADQNAQKRGDWTDPHRLYIETLAKHGFAPGPELDEAYKEFVRSKW